MTAATSLGTRPIQTPEGVVLNFQLATLGERFLALLLDALLLGIAIAVPWLLVLVSGAHAQRGWLVAFVTVLSFLLRHFYFFWFELDWQGRTLGKRALGIRVVDARGGPLRADAVFVRNVTRDVELLAPAVLLVAPAMAGDALGAVRAVSLLWIVVFGLMPLLNRDRMRVGDLLAGTIVVRNPRGVLSAELAAPAERPAGPAREREPALRFTPEQLDMYGIKELHVLADLLKHEETRAESDLAIVSEQVMRKIAWEREGQPVAPLRFLRAFYPALRAHLENKMVLGRRQEQKKQGRLRRD